MQRLRRGMRPPAGRRRGYRSGPVPTTTSVATIPISATSAAATSANRHLQGLRTEPSPPQSTPSASILLMKLHGRATRHETVDRVALAGGPDALRGRRPVRCLANRRVGFFPTGPVATGTAASFGEVWSLRGGAGRTLLWEQMTQV